MSEKEKTTPSVEEEKNNEEQYSLNDDRRVKVLSPGTLVAKRFFRNRLAVTGLVILVLMFIFSFVGGLISPYKQDQKFTVPTRRQRIMPALFSTTNSVIL